MLQLPEDDCLQAASYVAMLPLTVESDQAGRTACIGSIGCSGDAERAKCLVWQELLKSPPTVALLSAFARVSPIHCRAALGTAARQAA